MLAGLSGRDAQLLQQLLRLSSRIGIGGLRGREFQVLLSAGGISSAPEDYAELELRTREIGPETDCRPQFALGACEITL